MGTAASARGHDASKTFNDLFVFLSILIELASDRHPQSYEKLPSELASWTALSPKNLNATKYLISKSYFSLSGESRPRQSKKNGSILFNMAGGQCYSRKENRLSESGRSGR